MRLIIKVAQPVWQCYKVTCNHVTYQLVMAMLNVNYTLPHRSKKLSSMFSVSWIIWTALVSGVSRQVTSASFLQRSSELLNR